MNLENRFFYRLVNVVYYFSLSMAFIIIAIISCPVIPSGTILDRENSYIICNKYGFYWSFEKLGGFNLDIFSKDISLDKNGIENATYICEKRIEGVKEIHEKRGELVLSREKIDNALLKRGVSADSFINISGFRSIIPEYNEMSDNAIASYLYINYYSDMQENDFYSKFGVRKPSNSHLVKANELYSLDITYKRRDWTGFWFEVSMRLLYLVIFYSIANVARETLLYLAFGRKLTWDWLLKFLKIKKIYSLRLRNLIN